MPSNRPPAPQRSVAVNVYSLLPPGIRNPPSEACSSQALLRAAPLGGISTDGAAAGLP